MTTALAYCNVLLPDTVSLRLVVIGNRTMPIMDELADSNTNPLVTDYNVVFWSLIFPRAHMSICCVFVLFLPLNEVHELGLMYLNYEILLKGYQTIYLGESIPTESLLDLKNSYENITFVSYLTVEPI